MTADALTGAVLAAARERFAADGYAGAHVASIAQAAGVSVSTLYTRFASKQELYRRATGADPVAGGAPVGRARATREALVRAARTVIERDGFHAARIGDIAEQAGVSVGSFYSYFPAKLDVFREVLRRALADDLRPGRDPAPSRDRRERVHDAVQRYVRGYPRNARLIQRVDEAIGAHPELVGLRLQLHHAYADRITDSVRRWRELGLVDPDLDPQLTGDALAAMVGQATQIWVTYGQPHTPDGAVDTLTRLWCNALGLGDGSRHASGSELVVDGGGSTA